MNCYEAQNVIDQGVRPGSHAEQAAQLGFHLARCEDCQRYLQQQEEIGHRHAPVAPVSLPTNGAKHSRPAHANTTIPEQPRRQRKRPWLSIGISIMLLIFALSGVWVATILGRANDNLDAMIVTPVVQPAPSVVAHISDWHQSEPMLPPIASSAPTRTASPASRNPTPTVTNRPTVTPQHTIS
ncbi:MAG: hypothetical protein HC837_06370 [Chloroflexaceae bacterium]|nr:hypothetical protein [Chloroflexaceae bacterium]